MAKVDRARCLILLQARLSRKVTDELPAPLWSAFSPSLADRSQDRAVGALDNFFELGGLLVVVAASG